MPRVTREQLYDLVWSKPLSVLAKDYAISDVGLAKICKRLHVPRPARGYWAMTPESREGEKPSLPPVKGPADMYADLRDLPPPSERPPRVEANAVPVVVVRESLVGAHPAVLALNKMIYAGQGTSEGMFVVDGGGQATFRAGEESKRRALRIVDAICRSLRRRGSVVTVVHATRYGRGDRLVVEGRGGAVRLSLIERSDRLKHKRTPEEARRHHEYGFSSTRKYDFSPSGRLSLEILDATYSSRYARFTDAGRLLEDRLGEIVVAVEQKLVIAAWDENRRCEEQRAREEQQRREQRERALREHRVVLGKDLERMAHDWARARDIRAFLDVIAPLLVAGEGDNDEARDWLAWARSYEDEFDPALEPSEIAKVLEPEPRKPL